MDGAVRRVEGLTWWGAVASVVIYPLLHLLLVAALVTFGQRAGGYPPQALAIAVYGVLTVVGSGLAIRLALRSQTPEGRLLPLLALAIFLVVALAGAFFATPFLNGLGLRTEYAPYLDDDGAFALLNIGLAMVVVILALVARWRRLLVAALAAQGLALLANPGLIAVAVRYGLPQDAHGLLALPLLYLGAALALGWRPRAVHLAWCAGLLTAGALLSAGLLFGFSPNLWAALRSGQAYIGASVPRQIVVTAAFWPFVLGLPYWAWRLRRWAAGAPAGLGKRWVVAGVGLALVASMALVSWPYLGPAHGLGDNWLPEAGQTLGWINKTVPAGAYGPAGEALAALKTLFPWLVGAAALAWLALAAGRAARLGLRGALRAIGLPGGLALLGLAMLWQVPLLPFPFLYVQPPLIHGLAGALPQAIGQDGLTMWASVAYGLLGLSLIGLSAPLRDDQSKRRGWLTFVATLLALGAALILTAGLWAGTVQSLRAQRLLTLPEYRQAAQWRLALSLPVNAALALLGWAVVAAGRRALTTAGGPAALSPAALRRGLVLAGGLAVVGAFAFWQLTAMPVAETSPRDGATGVPTNAPIVVRLRPGLRNWGPGISATYADTGAYIRGTSGGSAEGTTSFMPEGGWRPLARVNVRVSSPAGRRDVQFSFTTAAGPAPGITPPGPLPMPAAPRE